MDVMHGSQHGKPVADTCSVADRNEERTPERQPGAAASSSQKGKGPRMGVCRSLDDAEAYTHEPKRRLRCLIARHGFPMKKVAGKYQGFYSEIDRWYAERLG